MGSYENERIPESLGLEKPSEIIKGSTATASSDLCPQVVTKDNRNGVPTLEPWQGMPG